MWEEAEEPLRVLGALLRECGGGAFVEGEKVGFADFIIAGFWQFARRVDEGGDLFGRLMKVDEAFERHFEACVKWLERDD